MCLGLRARLHLVHPLGFQTDDKAVRRAGLDYWKHVDVVEHDSADAFFAWAGGRRLHAFSARSPRPFTAAAYQAGDVLLFGRESVGLPSDVVARFPAWRIPFDGPIRSLNLSNAVAVVACHAAGQVDPDLYADPGPGAVAG